METNSLALMGLTFVIVATGCSANTRAAPCEPSPPTVSTCDKTASPPPEPNWCPWGEGVNVRMPLEGDVYLWHPSAPCKRKIHSQGDGPYEMMDTGVPCGPGVSFVNLPRGTCYRRGNPNEVVEIVYVTSVLVSRATENAGWQSCGGRPDLIGFVSAPECP